jgi:hypothetical protein
MRALDRSSVEPPPASQRPLERTAFDDVGLNELLEEMKKAPEIYRPSPFWQELTVVGLKQLEGGGFENFKRSVSMTYFNWSVQGILQHQFHALYDVGHQ